MIEVTMIYLVKYGKKNNMMVVAQNQRGLRYTASFELGKTKLDEYFTIKRKLHKALMQSVCDCSMVDEKEVDIKIGVDEIRRELMSKYQTNE